ncbi:hypothetical protein PAXINDRAFT_54741, partial [Paxillus involutus ATCC 200175]
LGDRSILTLTPADIPDPVAVSFANDIPRLNTMWDDVTPHWQGESVLKIKGHPIAIERWPEGTKHRWSGWRAIVHRYRQGTPEEFWQEFSVDGRRMSFTTIVTCLREDRKRESEQAARTAQEGSVQFTYRKGNQVHVLTKPSAIARRFKALNGNSG